MRKYFLLAIYFALMNCFLMAQAPGTGAYVHASFDTPGFDSVNLGNLNTRFNIPLVSRQGRGLPFSYSIQYEGLVWQNVNGTWVPSPGWGFTGMLNGTTFAGYLTHSVSYTDCPVSDNRVVRTTPVWDNFTYHDPFGAVHGFDYTYTFFCQGQPASSTGDGSALDGSGYTLTSRYTVRDRRGVAITPGSSATGQDPSSLQDTNGNEITFDGSSGFVDTTGTTALSVTGSNPVSFTYPVVKQANNATTASATLTYQAYTVRTNFGCNVTEYGSNVVNLVDHISLADGSTYNFTYEDTPGATDGAVTGRLASIKLPSGGLISYTYTAGCGNGINADGTPGSLSRVTSDGTRSYTRSPINGNATATLLQDEKGNQSYIQFSFLDGFFYETHRQVYDGNTSAAMLLDRYTCYNGAGAPCDGNGVQPPFTEVDVTESFNNGSQVLTRNGYDSYGVFLTSSAISALSGLLQTTSMAYNATGGLTSQVVTDGQGNTVSSVSYGYDESSVTTTSGLPNHTSPSSVPGNQTSSHISTDSGTINTSTQFYDTGMPLSATTPNGTTTYSYDATGTFVTGTALPTPSSGTALATSAVYDATSAALLSTTGMNSDATTVNVYDQMLRPTTETLPAGGQVAFSYSPNQISSTWNTGSPQNGSSATLLDSYGRLSRTARYAGPYTNAWYQTDTCYDAAGLVQFTSIRYQGPGFGAAPHCSGSGSTYTYDGLGRVTKVSTDDGDSKTAYYNRAVETTDVNGVQEITQFDGLGRVTGVCEISSSNLAGEAPVACGMDIAGTGYITSYAYDTANHKVTITQGSQQRIFQTDAAGRTTLVQEPERGVTTYGYTYTSGGLQVTRIRPKANQPDRNVTTTTTTQYDSLGRLTSVSYDDSQTATKYFWYDTVPLWLGWSTTPSNIKGRLVATATNAWGNTRAQYSYDTPGNVTALWQCAPSICNSSAQASRVISMSYDLIGNLTYEIDPTSGAITYGRSPAGEVTSISSTSWDGAGNSPSPQYSLVSNVVNGPFGPTNWALGNNTTVVRSYDSMGRNNGGWLCSGTGGQSQSAYCSGNTQMHGFFIVNSGSRVTGMCDTVVGQCQVHNYDEFNRLSSVSSNGSVGSYGYTYDRWGNRLSQTYNNGGPVTTTWTYNSANQILSSTNTPVPHFDAAGNETQDESGHTYAYDAEGKVLSVDGGNTASYTYDALDQRIQVMNASGTTEYLYDPFGRRTSNWDASVNFGNHGRLYWNGSQIAWRGYYGQTMYEHQDWLGTERMRTNYQGQTIAALHSLAFGEGSYTDQVSGGGTEEDNQFTSQDHDNDSGTEHFKYRQYSSVQGRWMSPDPYDGSYSSLNPQSLNRYVYTLNNPLSLTDPFGLDPCGGGDDDEAASGGHIGNAAGEGDCGLDGGGGGGSGCPVDACVSGTVPGNPDPSPTGPCDIWNCVFLPTSGIPSLPPPSSPSGPPLPCQVKTQTALNNALNTSSIYLTPTFQLQGYAPGLKGGNYNYNYFLPGVTQVNILAATGGTGRFNGAYAGLHIPQPGGSDPIIAIYGGGIYDEQFGSFVTAHYDTSNPYQDLVSLFEHLVNDVLLKRGRGGCKS